MIPVRIAGTASLAPGRAVSTEELVRRLSPPPDPADVEARTGIASRYVVEPGTTTTSLGTTALARALEVAGLPAEALGRIIYVSSIGGDVTIPATANRIAGALGLAGTCDCFDLDNACMGFLTALDVGIRSVATGTGPVGIVVVELGSRIIDPADPRPYVVFGDAVAAVVLTSAAPGEAGVLGSWLRNDGIAGGDVVLVNPLHSGRLETIRFTAPNKRLAADAIAWIRRATDAVLASAGMTLAEVEWVLPHQPNGTLLRAIVDDLGLDPTRITPVVHEFGSIGAASIPVSLDRLLRGERVRPGDRVLMVGVGAGISSGAVLYRVG